MIRYFKFILFSLIILSISCDEDSTYNLEVIKDGNGADYGLLNPDYNGKTTWNEFEVVTINAQVDEDAVDGVTFDGWDGDIVTDENEVSFMMDSDKFLRANFSINEYIITIDDASGGSIQLAPNPVNSISDNELVYQWGEDVLFTAEPDPGYRFDSWGNDFSEESNESVSRIITSDLHVSATFTNQCALTTNATTGGSITPVYNENIFDCGTAIDITATPNSGYNFIGWSGNIDEDDIINGETISVIIDSDKTITANFSAYFILEVSTNPEEGGEISITPDLEQYELGDVVSVTADPDTDNGYYFTGWTGDVPQGSENDNPIALTMNQDIDLIANFDNTYQLTTSVTGNGSIAISPELDSYEYGTQVTLTANPDPDYNFNSWSGNIDEDDIINGETISVIIDSDKTITANFIEQFTIDLSIPEEGIVGCTLNPSLETYNDGDSVTIECVLEDNFEFVTWTGDLTSDSNPDTFEITSNMEISLEVIELFEINICDSLENGVITVVPDQSLFPDGYPEGTEVEITAIPDECHAFGYWSSSIEDILQPNSSFILTIDSSIDICAEFDFLGFNLIDLTIAPEGSGTVNLDPNGGTYNSYCVGEEVTLTATSSDITNWYFTGWSGDIEENQSSENQITVTIPPQIDNEDVEITASFTELCDIVIDYDEQAIELLTFNPELNNDIQHTSISDNIYTYFCDGSNVNVTAHLNDGYVFDSWTGDVTGDSLTVELNLNTDLNVELNTLEIYTLSFGDGCLDGSIEVDGVVTDTNIEYDYNEGDEITLLAIAEDNWEFVNWSLENELNSDENPLSITFDSDKAIDCVFDEILETLVIYTNGNGIVNVILDDEENNPEQNNDLPFGENECSPYSCATNSSCDCYIIQQGTHVYLQPDDSDNSIIFINWTGQDLPDEVIPGEDNIDFILNSDDNHTELTANFVNYYTLDANLEGLPGSTEDPICSLIIDPPPIGGLGYSENEEIELTVECTDSHWSFNNWDTDNVDLSPEQLISSSITFQVNENTQISGMCLQQFVLSNSVSPEEAGQIDFNPYLDSLIYDAGAQVELTAVDTTDGYYFVNWTYEATGDTISSDNPYTLTMDQDIDLIANFDNTYQITTSVTGNGSIGIYPELDSYEYGTVVEFEAIPDSNYNFDGWSINGDNDIFPDPAIAFEIVSDMDIIANFSEYFILNISIQPEEGGEVEILPNWENYSLGDQVALSATPDSDNGYYFVNWTDDATGEVISSANPYLLTMDENKNLTANFSNMYDLTVFPTPNGSGDFTLSPLGTPIEDGASFEWGTPVVLEVFGLDQNNFCGWFAPSTLDDDSSTVSILMDQDLEVYASFCQYWLLETSIEDGDESDGYNGGSITINPDQSQYDDGESVNLIATPDTTAGYYFINWTDDMENQVSIDTSIDIVMDENKNLTANFSNLYQITTSNPDTLCDVTVTYSDGNPIPDDDMYEYDSSLIIEAEAIDSENYDFYYWNYLIDGEIDTTVQNPLNYQVVEDNNFIATCKELCQLSIDLNSGEGVIDVSAFQGNTSNSTVETPISDSSSFTYFCDSEITLTATPNEDYGFTLWTDGVNHFSGSSFTFTLDSDMTYSAVFSELFELTLEESDNGTITHDTTFPLTSIWSGTDIELTAVPDSGYQFNSWTGDLSGNVNPEDILMDSDKVIGATFNLIPHYLNLDIIGGGTITLSPEGIETDNPDSTIYEHGDIVQLTANSDSGFYFDGVWTVNGLPSQIGDTLEIVMDQDYDISINLVEVYSLTINQPDPYIGSIDVNPDPDIEEFNYYYANNSVNLSATSGDFYEFSHWTGDVDTLHVDIEDSTIEILMDSDKTIGAVFEIYNFTITLDIEGNGSVLVTGADEISDDIAGNEYQYQAEAYSEVTLEAVPNPGENFVRWQINGVPDDLNPYNIAALAQNYTISAIFTEEE